MVSCPTAQVSMRILPQSKAARSRKKGFSHGVPQDCIPWRGPAGGEQGTPDPGQLRNRGLEPWSSGVVPGVLWQKSLAQQGSSGYQGFVLSPCPFPSGLRRPALQPPTLTRRFCVQKTWGSTKVSICARGRPWGTPSPYILLVARLQCAQRSNRGWCQYQCPRGRPKRPRAPGFSPASSSCPE